MAEVEQRTRAEGAKRMEGVCLAKEPVGERTHRRQSTLTWPGGGHMRRPRMPLVSAAAAVVVERAIAAEVGAEGSRRLAGRTS